MTDQPLTFRYLVGSGEQAGPGRLYNGTDAAEALAVFFKATGEGKQYVTIQALRDLAARPEDTAPPLPPVGHRWTDNDGWPRVKTPWGFNAFASESGARAQAVDLGRVGQHWYIWRLADGSYDVTASANPQTPGHPATLVDVAEIRRTPSGDHVAVPVPFRTGEKTQPALDTSQTSP
jgi:hypothetical protein